MTWRAISGRPSDEEWSPAPRGGGGGFTPAALGAVKDDGVAIPKVAKLQGRALRFAQVPAVAKLLLDTGTVGVDSVRWATGG